MDYKTGYVLHFKTGDDLFSNAIRFYNQIVYKSDGYVHSAVILNGEKLIVGQALPSGFEIKKWNKNWLDNQVKNGDIKVSRCIIELKDLEEVAKQYEGKPYGFMDILAIGTILLFRHRSIGIDGSRRLICSEAVARLLYDCSDKIVMLGYGKRKDKNQSEYKKSFDLITPTDIALSKYLKDVK